MFFIMCFVGLLYLFIVFVVFGVYCIWFCFVRLLIVSLCLCVRFTSVGFVVSISCLLVLLFCFVIITTCVLLFACILIFVSHCPKVGYHSLFVVVLFIVRFYSVFGLCLCNAFCLLFLCVTCAS